MLILCIYTQPIKAAAKRTNEEIDEQKCVCVCVYMKMGREKKHMNEWMNEKENWHTIALWQNRVSYIHRWILPPLCLWEANFHIWIFLFVFVFFTRFAIWVDSSSFFSSHFYKMVGFYLSILIHLITNQMQTNNFISHFLPISFNFLET